jgi:regulator of protease activity HflC (stomatin/prohibitin superfamily)
VDARILTIMFILVTAIFVLFYLASGIKVLKESERIAILRLGKFLGIKGPGIIWATPILDKIAF